MKQIHSLLLRSGAVMSVCAVLVMVLSLPSWCRAAGAPAPVLTAGQKQQAERMYREGILPSGEEMPALIRDDVQVKSGSFSCVSCHLRSGIGSIEGQVLSPPVTGQKLAKEYYQYNPIIPEPNRLPPRNMMDRPGAKPFHRPAYNDEKLAEVIRFGVNPAGRTLNSVMPRYPLDDKEMDLLIAYLKTLSDKHSPGVYPKEIRFATVIAGDVPAERRKEMLATLDAVIKDHNAKAKRRSKHLNLGENGYVDAPFNYPMFTLARWELSGAPSTWGAQLEERYRKEPVFALLGGMASGPWQPMHEFCERNQIPCLLPLTDLPVISDSDWYTLYFSKGGWQEGETAARYLDRVAALPADVRILQVVEESPVARRVADGFDAAWKELSRTAPRTITVKPGKGPAEAEILRVAAEEKASVILLWVSRPSAALLEELAGAAPGLSRIHLSSTLMDDHLETIPRLARPVTYVSYPYRMAEGSELFHVNARAWLKKYKVSTGSLRVAERLFALTKVLLEPFQVVKRDFNPAGQGNGLVIMEEQFEMMMHVKRNYYRDYLLDVIGMMADSHSLAYERISFGPGQRYVSKGCYIVQVAPGEGGALVAKSDWVIH